MIRSVLEIRSLLHGGKSGLRKGQVWVLEAQSGEVPKRVAEEPGPPGISGDGEKWLQYSFILEVNLTSLGDRNEGE